MESQPTVTEAVRSQSTEPTHVHTPQGTVIEKSMEKEENFKKESNDLSQDISTSGKAESVDAASLETDFVQGVRLFMIITSLTFGTFLMLLDTSIVSTVSTFQIPVKKRKGLECPCSVKSVFIANEEFLGIGYPAYHNSVPCLG